MGLKGEEGKTTGEKRGGESQAVGAARRRVGFYCWVGGVDRFFSAG